MDREVTLLRSDKANGYPRSFASSGIGYVVETTTPAIQNEHRLIWSAESLFIGLGDVLTVTWTDGWDRPDSEGVSNVKFRVIAVVRYADAREVFAPGKEKWIDAALMVHLIPTDPRPMGPHL